MRKKVVAWLSLIVLAILSLTCGASIIAESLTVTTITCSRVAGGIGCTTESRVRDWVVGQKTVHGVIGAQVDVYEDSQGYLNHYVELMTQTGAVRVTPSRSRLEQVEGMARQIDAFAHDATASSLSVSTDLDLPGLTFWIAVLLSFPLIMLIASLVTYLAGRRRGRARGTRHQLQQAVEGRE